ncbi:hypothetical protein BT69DRAFT_601703 [Atractiella rhizophila]|nr:hypothetical protein BT69DRAFT_601703 [Atractiella rhizophila]
MESSPPFNLSLRSRNGRGKMLWTVSKNTGRRRMALQLLALCLALLPCARADSTSIDDTDPRIDYEPQGAWVPTTDQKSFNNTLTSTFLAGATATLKFNGSAVFYYGSTNMSRSLSNVFLDGDPTILHTFSNDYVGQVKLFEASNLDPMKEHTITIVNTGGNSGILTLDYFVICETFCPELLGSVPKGLTPGAIAGIVLGVLAFVSILFLVLLFLYLRRRRRSFPSSSFSEKSSAFSRPIAALMGYQAARQDEKDMAEKKRQTSRKKKNMVGLADPECLDDETECLTGAGSPPIQEHEPGATPVPSIGMVMANQAPVKG